MGRAQVPRSALIAAELRAEIASGALQSGDLLPSTREITRRWGVAMATATKALTLLQREGLVVSRPGVGTIVATRPPSAGRGSAAPRAQWEVRTPLGQSIVKEAVEVADAEGLDRLSMRRVAAELGVSTMALYHHVQDKDDLLRRMVEHALQEGPLPDAQSGRWREDLEVSARSMWAAFRRHPWLASVLSITRPQPVASGLTYVEWNLQALTRAGIEASTALTVHLALANYVQGTALNLELERHSQAESGMDAAAWLGTQESDVREIADSGILPIFTQLDQSGYEIDLDGIFDFGLERFLDGVVEIIPARVR